MNYHKYELKTAPETADILVAFLSNSPFDTFEEMPEGINAYAPATASEEEIEAQLLDLQRQFDFTWQKELILGQNWNELWESNFQPVVVGDFCAVRADFHEPIKNVKWELVINPKMAFGTGHHETTWQCIAAIEHLPLAGTKVLDYGCGTGILAILASKQGAVEVEAVDIEAESYRNTVENCAANGVHNVTARLGTLNAVEGRNFDGILANINRHVILESLPALSGLLKPKGWLLISGILLSDEDIVTEAALAAGFSKKEMKSRGNWLCGVFEKNIFGWK
ncbi:MAG: 50S ribosomal protein L11 methyltransferase [Saprospiraceae bacterium]|nr:50S ribosomal protein L11 methyltransferase [Saprospiraceae bacterium]